MAGGLTAHAIAEIVHLAHPRESASVGIMTSTELAEILAQLRRYGCELDDLEVKTAKGGTPKNLHRDLSALANTHGGILLLGLDERRGFKAVGVGDVQRLQEDIASLARQMDPVLDPSISHHVVEGASVVAVEIPALPPTSRPCHLRSEDAFTGSYVRVGNTDQRMTQYQVYGYLSGRGQPTFDEEAVPTATLADLDDGVVLPFLQDIESRRPRAFRHAISTTDRLRAFGIVADDGGSLRPTLSGLLLFGKYPQQFEPQLVITFMQYQGVDERDKGPRGERLLDNRKFEGTVPEVVDAAEAHIMGHIRTAAIIDGLYRRDVPEYPRAAVREALLNAVAHRDYSGYKRGSQVQVKLFADRLEVRSPGGLFGDVTVDTLEDGQTTRNRRLMQVMEDLNLVENRGTGIDSMVAEMREAHMEPPRFGDDRSWFTVTFYNHILLMSEPDLAWLNDATAALTLNDRQRLALLYMRHNHRMTNSDYRRIHRVDRMLARRELQDMVGAGATEMRGVRGGAHYELSVGTDAVAAQSGDALRRDAVLRHVHAHGEIANRQCRDLLGLPSAQTAWRLLSVLVRDGALQREGTGRGSKYVIPKRER